MHPPLYNDCFIVAHKNCITNVLYTLMIVTYAHILYAYKFQIGKYVFKNVLVG